MKWSGVSQPSSLNLRYALAATFCGTGRPKRRLASSQSNRPWSVLVSMPRSVAVISAAMACSVSAGDVDVEERALQNTDDLEEQHSVALRSAGGPDTTQVDDPLVR